VKNRRAITDDLRKPNSDDQFYCETYIAKIFLSDGEPPPLPNVVGPGETSPSRRRSTRAKYLPIYCIFLNMFLGVRIGRCVLATFALLVARIRSSYMTVAVLLLLTTMLLTYWAYLGLN